MNEDVLFITPKGDTVSVHPDDMALAMELVHKKAWRIAPTASQSPAYRGRVAAAVSGPGPDPQSMLIGSLPALAAIGGTGIGGLLGPAGAIVGGGLGAGSGELARQVLATSLGRTDLAPQSASSGAMGVLREALLGAGTAGLGQVASRATRSLGRSLMEDALRPSATAAKPAIVNRGASAVDVMERERIPVGGPKGRGFQRTSARVGESVAAAEASLARVPGKPFTVRDVVFEASDDLKALRAKAANARQVQEVDDFLNEAAAFGQSRTPRGGAKPQRLTANELNERKRTWQQMAKGNFAATARTGSKQTATSSGSDFEKETAKALAAAANRLLERAAPGVRAINRETSELGLLRRAMLEAEARPATWNPFAHGNAVTNASFAMLRPPVTSRMGMALTDPRLLWVLRTASPAMMPLIEPAFPDSGR